MKATLTQTQKQADIRFRVELKNRPHIVIYQVMSAGGQDMYDVTLVGGKVNNCNCASRKPCYHMRDVQAREDARREAQTQTQMDTLAREMEDDGLRFNAWHGSNRDEQVERPISERGVLNNRNQGFSLLKR